MPNRYFSNINPQTQNGPGNAPKRLRNDDGREMGDGYNDDMDKGGPVESARLTFAPNEGAPVLPDTGKIPGAEH